MDKRIFTLAHDMARANARKCVDEAPDGYRVIVEEPKRSLDQNARLHARLQEIGDAIGWIWMQAPIDLDDLKTLFVAAFRKTQGRSVRLLRGLDGELVLANWRTRDMSKAEFTDLMTMIDAWAAENVEEVFE